MTIADRLKEDSSIIADEHVASSVLFLDLANFTPLAETMPPEDLVHLLNSVFSKLDELAEKHCVEKIKTIGDSYMVAAGVPVAQTDHAIRIGDFALDALDAVRKFSGPDGDPLTVRIGIDTGSVVAGVIGVRKFIYDMWGDIVNTASRMESHGVVNHIQTTKGYREATRDTFAFEARGPVFIKGKGEMETYFLRGRANQFSDG
jgi:class 3 adenylate cyclase